jgi:hypothetical protein
MNKKIEYLLNQLQKLLILNNAVSINEPHTNFRFPFLNCRNLRTGVSVSESLSLNKMAIK